MKAQILIPLDNSATSAKVIRCFLAQAHNFSAPFTLLHVVEDNLSYRAIPEPQLKLIREQSRQAGRELLERYAMRFNEAGFRPQLLLESGDPVQVIKRLDTEGSIALLVMARQGTGEVSEVLFGSVANALLHKIKCPMLLY